jgi:hypothetical protein
MADWRQVLSAEFNADEGTYLHRLRLDHEFDRAAFVQLATAMRDCCHETASVAVIDRTLAHGFWFVPTFSDQWIAHPNFPKTRTDAYYKRASDILFQLAEWFFSGICPVIGNLDVSLLD